MHVKAIISLFLSFYFTLASLFPLTDFQQLADLVHVWEHFQYHNSSGECSNPGLIDFLSDHYLQTDTHHHKDANRHNDLPLKSLYGETIQLVLTIASNEWLDCTLNKENSGDFFTLFPISTGFTSRIFQPPIRLAA